MDALPQTTTLLEWLRWTYPDHCQRIVEEVWRQDPRNAEAVLSGPPGVYPMAQCFTWALTEEGHDYWHGLSQEPFPRGKRHNTEVVKKWNRTWGRTQADRVGELDVPEG